MFRAAEKRFGQLDVLVNNAAVFFPASWEKLTSKDWDRILGVNLKGVFFGCQAAARVMVEQGSGSIVNMASGAVDVPSPGIACYAIAKAGVVQLTHTLAIELARHKVRVNAVAPGYVMTAMTARHFTGPDGVVDEEKLRETRDRMGRGTPLGRVGEPEDIAHAVLYLACDASSFVTGQVLRPNGGVVMPW